VDDEVTVIFNPQFGTVASWNQAGSPPTSSGGIKRSKTIPHSQAIRTR
jgi:hypothetical protein